MVVLEYFGFTAGVLALLLVPGYLWLRRAGVDSLIALYAGPGAVCLAGAAVVALGVILPWSVRVTAIAGLVLIVASAVACGVSLGREAVPPRAELGGIVAFLLAAVALAAYAATPSAPYGDWAPYTVGSHRVDTPRWPNQPSDNTLPFRTGQVAIYKQGGNEIRSDYSSGWWLSDRTPLTGLDFAFFAESLGVHITSQNIDHITTGKAPMAFKDQYGFWSYQLVAMLLNAAIALGVYLLARVWLGRRVATIAALLAGVLPGLFLNSIYTWPKPAIAYFVLVGLACAMRRKPVLAGAFAVLGYLVHPAGVVWLLPVAIALLRSRDPGVSWRGTLARFLAPVVVLAAPWLYFTSQVMHATSRWTTAPFGYLMSDPTKFSQQLSIAWKFFRQHGVMYAIWVRAQSTAGSLFPGLGADIVPTHNQYGGRIWAAYTNAHGFSVWGMVGFVLFGFAIVVLVQRWRDFRWMALWVALPAVIVAELANGETYPFANQSMFPLVGLVAIVVAVGLIEASVRVRMRLLVIAAIEFGLLAYGALYRPYRISVPAIVALTILALAAQVALFALLARELELGPPTRAWLRARRAGSARARPGAVPTHPAATG